MPSFTDQLGREIVLTQRPQRIVSLVPSQTELLAYLGLEEEVVGITKFCTRPEHWYRNKTRIGGTKDLRYDLIKRLQPDLIIGNKEENKPEQVELFMDEIPTWISDINTLESALQMISTVGALCEKTALADELVKQIEGQFAGLKPLMQGKKVWYLIWQQPWMAAGPDTFIGYMLNRLGFDNLAASLGQRYSVVNSEVLESAKPDVVLLSSEPYPFKDKHVELLQPKLPHTQIILVDGSPFSWYGSRLLDSVPYFNSLFEH
jgi:ABC-type Fe3+-hydroxamate transport system substrate-binding protein